MSIGKEVQTEYTIRLQDHIKYVREAGERIGVRGELLNIHDNSKWWEPEFEAYAKYFCSGVDKSPVDADSVSDEFSVAWLHHIHHNPHHWQHWIFSDGYTPKGSTVENGVVQMPEHYALEMIADWMGASRTYTGSWDMTDWLHKNMSRIRVHSKTADYLRDVLGSMADVVHPDVVNGGRFAQEMR